MEDESCRILTVSSTIEVAVAFIESVMALGASRSAAASTTPSSPGKLSVPLAIPWTIANRYYAADVHFSAWTMERLFPDLFDREPPALVFVWSEGQPYVRHVKEIARLMKLREYEPEVALAVRIPGTQPEMENEESVDRDDAKDEDEIDSMLLSYGFEYVDATRLRETTNGMEDDIPALPRVLDALSTIIWPSMRSNKSGPGVSGPRGPPDFDQSFDAIDFVDEEVEKEKENMLHELLEDDKLFASLVLRDDETGQEGGGKVDAEMKGQWKRPWISVSASSSTTATVSEMNVSPTEVMDGESWSPFERHSTDTERGEEVSLRFEDDFSVFVSAPPPEGEGRKAGWTGLDSGSLHLDAGFRYRSLGSVSDFGESEDGGYDRLDDEEEILGPDAGRMFNVERVFGMLQEYKTEIAGMEDEEEKRKTAARVALGLVYGL